MVKGLYTAYTGLVHEQNRMDIMTNNLANVNTVGYKREGSTGRAFDDILSVKLKDASIGEQNIEKLGNINPGVEIGNHYTDYSQGSFRNTNNTYDLAISGNGFFAIEHRSKSGESSIKYTRDGSFSLNKEGYLVTCDGDFVLDINQSRIKVDTLTDSKIERDGKIYQNGTELAQVGLFDFEQYLYLSKYGENLLQPLDAATMKAADGEIYSGYLEMSNVQTVTEMVNLITITRAYESNQKIMQTMDNTLETAVQLGKLR